VADAVRFLGVSRSTVGRWIASGALGVSAKRGRLSFQDLVTAHRLICRRPIASLIGLRGVDSKPIMIDPRLSFGRPTIAGTGIPLSIVASRFRAGESISALAQDYRIPERSIHAAVRASIPPVLRAEV
jgi:uncharacterized protein (DUF433 family)